MNFLIYLHNHRLHWYLQVEDGVIVARNSRSHRTLKDCLWEIDKVKHCNSTTPVLNLKTGKPVLIWDTAEAFK